MGLDLGALLRSGAAGMSGHRTAQIEREEREREAQRQALQQYLINQQVKTSQVSADRDRAYMDELRRKAGIETRDYQTEMGTQAAEATMYRGKYPELAGEQNDALVVEQGKAKDRHAEDLELVERRESLYGQRSRTGDDDRIMSRLRSEWDEQHRNTLREREGDTTTRIAKVGHEALRLRAQQEGREPPPPYNVLAPADTAQMLEAVRREVPEASPEQVRRFQQSIRGETGDGVTDVSEVESRLDAIIEQLQTQLAELERQFPTER